MQCWWRIVQAIGQLLRLWQVSVPVDKAIGLIKWVQSLGHEVPELQELDEIKRRQASQPLLACSPPCKRSDTCAVPMVNGAVGRSSRG